MGSSSWSSWRERWPGGTNWTLSQLEYKLKSQRGCTSTEIPIPQFFSTKIRRAESIVIRFDRFCFTTRYFHEFIASGFRLVSSGDMAKISILTGLLLALFIILLYQLLWSVLNISSSPDPNLEQPDHRYHNSSKIMDDAPPIVDVITKATSRPVATDEKLRKYPSSKK